MELEGFPEYKSQALGVYSLPLTFGSSATFESTRSSSVLKSYALQFFKSLIWTGRQLNSLGPWIWKEFSLSVLMLAGAFFVSSGILHNLPSLPWLLASTPQFGTIPSRTFHTYMILYLSSRLCWDSSFS